MIPDDQLQRLRKELETAEKPLFFFDDDPDGLCSFLLLYRIMNRGKGVVIKSTPQLSDEFFRKVEEFMPDKVFILDKPMISQKMLDLIHNVNIKTVWLDHHPVQQRELVDYYNPRIEDPQDNRPTAYWAYKIAQKDLWIAMVGMLGDWFMPEFREEFSKQYPDLLPENIVKAQDALFTTRVGLLARIFSFNLKGATTEVNRSIKILTRIEDPYEILDQKTPRGKLIYKHYEKLYTVYAGLVESVKVNDENIILFTYKDNKMSFTSDMSNELLYRHPDKIIFLAREKAGEMKCSIRASHITIPPILKEALQGVSGYGGGHDHACGACIKKRDFQEFLKRFRELVEKPMQ
ncbi:MAG: DHH family phosphoesterase [Nanoarchaeota archaeon]